MADDQNRNHPATPRRLQKARESGDLALSREIVGFLVFGCACLMLGLLGTRLIGEILAALSAIIRGSYNEHLSGTKGLLVGASAAAKFTAPILGASAIAGVVGVAVQSGFFFHPAAIQPNFSRLNPSEGFKKLFGVNGLIELTRAMAKLALMTGTAWLALKGRIGEVASLPWRDPHALIDITAVLGVRLLVIAAVVQGGTAVLDWMIVRFRFQRRHRMSREDLKEEFKETEGNPHTKSRIRRIQRVKRYNVVKAVQAATVVVTNPTHYAVALVYDKAVNAAPRVAAKGADLVAQRIRDLARLNGVPIVEKPELARALFRLEPDTEIPPEHYKTVAEIIAFVWRLNEDGRSRRLV